MLPIKDDILTQHKPVVTMVCASGAIAGVPGSEGGGGVVCAYRRVHFRSRRIHIVCEEGSTCVL